MGARLTALLDHLAEQRGPDAAADGVVSQIDGDFPCAAIHRIGLPEMGVTIAHDLACSIVNRYKEGETAAHRADFVGHPFSRQDIVGEDYRARGHVMIENTGHGLSIIDCSGS